MTSLALDFPLFQGLQVDQDPPAVKGGVGSVHADERERLSTAGSFRITRARACCRSAMAAKEIDWGASEIPG